MRSNIKQLKNSKTHLKTLKSTLKKDQARDLLGNSSTGRFSTNFWFRFLSLYNCFEMSLNLEQRMERGDVLNFFEQNDVQASENRKLVSILGNFCIGRKSGYVPFSLCPKGTDKNEKYHTVGRVGVFLVAWEKRGVFAFKKRS